MEKYDRQGLPIVDGMAAIYKHGETSGEMEEIFKKNGSLSDYQKSIKRTKPTKEDEARVSVAFKNLLST